MSNRLINIIQWATIVIGITGVSLKELLPTQPLVTNFLIFVTVGAFVVLAVVQLWYRDPNHFEGKQEVDTMWNRLLLGADHSVRVFAGDVSWAEKNQEALNDRRQTGVELRVICRWPSTPLLIQQVRALFLAGVKVRFYGGDHVRVRGLVVDTDSGAEAGTALTVVKLPKGALRPTPGKPGTDDLASYHARRYVPSEDINYIAMLQQLFDSVWETLPEGLLLDRVALDLPTLRDLLASIPHYAHLTPANLAFRRVPLASLYSCCRTVKAPRLKRTATLIQGYKEFKLEYFEPCRVEREAEPRTLLLPPIVEQQGDGRLVVIDGMHRLYQLTTSTDAQEALCLVLTETGPLASDPIPFQDVRIAPTKKPRGENFPNYRPENFRDIKAIYRQLAVLVDRYPVQPTPSSAG